MEVVRFRKDDVSVEVMENHQVLRASAGSDGGKSHLVDGNFTARGDKFRCW